MNSDPNLPASTPKYIKRCPRCGKVLPNDAIFCADCGTNLESGSQPAPMTAPAYAKPTASNAPLGVSDFLVMRIVSMIPLIGLIMLLIWAFSPTDNENRRNFCRAELILYVLGQILGTILLVFFSSTLLKTGAFY